VRASQPPPRRRAVGWCHPTHGVLQSVKHPTSPSSRAATHLTRERELSTGTAGGTPSRATPESRPALACPNKQCHLMCPVGLPPDRGKVSCQVRPSPLKALLIALPSAFTVHCRPSETISSHASPQVKCTFRRLSVLFGAGRTSTARFGAFRQCGIGHGPSVVCCSMRVVRSATRHEQRFLRHAMASGGMCSRVRTAQRTNLHRPDSASDTRTLR
jgi:hypothetical protein